MSSRLASFKGPSTPTSSPARPTSTQASPARQTESTFHRKVRTLLQELRSISETWEDIVILDGLKHARNLVDARTDLDNAITALPNRLPKTYVVGPKLEAMEQSIESLDAVILKLEKLFRRMNTVMDNLDALVIEAHKVKGYQWVHEEPLWISWSLEKFATSIPEILVPYHRSLASHKQFISKLRSHSISFDDSKRIVEQWAEQPYLAEDGWEAKWQDLCSVEVERWDKT
ncbi:hypothetical protein BKA70DRAFT_1457881 [Coprinopsis sp. MPI-PUGE-AT-0042]|nr:hypothetical protein BKA70DRAFT_1457881 [Coprinopsis sp. MPI-PUGE-AT-0042]